MRRIYIRARTYVWDVKTYRAVKNLYLLRTCIYIVYIVYIVLLYIYCIIISYCIILLIMFLLVGLSSFRYDPVQSVEFVTSCHFCIFCMVVYDLYFQCIFNASFVFSMYIVYIVYVSLNTPHSPIYFSYK